MGRAQTGGNSGVADHQKDLTCIVEDVWKGAPQEVKVPYTKCIEDEDGTRVMPGTWNPA